MVARISSGVIFSDAINACELALGEAALLTFSPSAGAFDNETTSETSSVKSSPVGFFDAYFLVP